MLATASRQLLIIGKYYGNRDPHRQAEFLHQRAGYRQPGAFGRTDISKNKFHYAPIELRRRVAMQQLASREVANGLSMNAAIEEGNLADPRCYSRSDALMSTGA
jgi:hypothetical protein